MICNKVCLPASVFLGIVPAYQDVNIVLLQLEQDY